MLVDPSTDQLDALQTVFPLRNYEIFHVVQINDAKEVLEKNKFAFVLIEIQNFARDAEHFARAVRETHYGQVVPILFLADHLDDDVFFTLSEQFTSLAGQKLSKLDYLCKPLKPQKVKARMTPLVELFEASQNLALLNEVPHDIANLKKDFFLEDLLDPVIGMNQQGLISVWTSQAERVFGWKKEEVLSQKLSSVIIPEKFREAHDRGMTYFLKTGFGPILNTRIEVAAIRKDGAEIPMELTVIPIKTESGYYFYSNLRDLSDKKALEAYRAGRS